MDRIEEYLNIIEKEVYDINNYNTFKWHKYKGIDRIYVAITTPNSRYFAPTNIIMFKHNFKLDNAENDICFYHYSKDISDILCDLRRDGLKELL